MDCFPDSENLATTVAVAGEHILVVDDIEMNVKLLDVLLRMRNGYRVTTASSAEAALDELSRPDSDFAAMLIDVRLPGMDGLALTRIVRGRERFDRMAIIAVTAHAMVGDEDLAISAGCDAYVSKPIDTRTFPALVASHISRRRGLEPT